MLLIGAINLGLGYCAYEPPPPEPEKIPLVIPPSPYDVDGGVDAPAAVTPR
jgi:hypothetical protein